MKTMQITRRQDSIRVTPRWLGKSSLVRRRYRTERRGLWGGGWQSGIKRWNTPMPHHRFFGHKRNASFAQALTPQCRTAWLRHRSEGSNTIRLKPTKTEAMMRIEMGGKMRERERERGEKMI